MTVHDLRQFHLRGDRRIENYRSRCECLPLVLIDGGTVANLRLHAQRKLPNSESYFVSQAAAKEVTEAKKMARVRVPRPARRHLVRWTDDMDKKLLLTIQSECNRQNIVLPWLEIGQVMGEGITGGAVVQHLAKLRGRMVAQHLSVPPPLRRGGGARISTGPSLPRSAGPSSARVRSVKLTGSVLGKRGMKANSDSDDSDGGDSDSDADAEYGKRKVKSTKNEGKKAVRRTKKSKNSDGDTENGSEGSSNGIKNETYSDGEPVVATGAPFLALEDDVPGQAQVNKKTVIEEKPSLIVTLNVPTDRHYSGKEDSLEEQSAEQSDNYASHGDDSDDGNECQGNTVAKQASSSNEAIANAMAMYRKQDFAYYDNAPPTGVITSNTLAATTSPTFNLYDTPTSATYNVYDKVAAGAGSPALGGLPSSNGFNGTNNFLNDLEDVVGSGTYGANGVSGRLSSVGPYKRDPEAQYAYENGMYNNQLFGQDYGSMQTNTYLSNGFDANGQAAHGLPNHTRAYPQLPQLATTFQYNSILVNAPYSAETDATQSTTVNQTPVTEDADHGDGLLSVSHGSFDDVVDDGSNDSHFDVAYVDDGDDGGYYF